ncbi:hypothetical protein IFM89_003882 [Coptis chinensis]|uniref:F-box associated beta-propeller type 3 domain-containing protein n=1 Tax=Coptis chinensis TaxID=261450 RepID=A0A835I1G9_9MAGN|nr:hypothetical protein IFM89_003882 [Coptis chinensis]
MNKSPAVEAAVKPTMISHILIFLWVHISKFGLTDIDLMHNWSGHGFALQWSLVPFTSASRPLALARSSCAICNGLLCLAYELEEYCFDIYIWNPVTKEHVTIPCPPIPSDFPINDPFTNTKFAFGFHQGSNEYKVVRIVSTYPPNDSSGKVFQTHVSVYTLGDTTGLWKATLDPLSSYIDSVKTALVNGSRHWLACNPFDRMQKFIVSFDIKDEVFQEISLPNCLDYDCDTKIRQLGGLLCIFLYCYEDVVEVMVLMDIFNFESEKKGAKRIWTGDGGKRMAWEKFRWLIRIWAGGLTSRSLVLSIPFDQETNNVVEKICCTHILEILGISVMVGVLECELADDHGAKELE